MDINALRLSDEQIYSVTSIHPRFVKKWPGTRALADAQLRKAVNGIADWLEGLENDLLIPAHFGKYLREAAGIPKEGEVADSGTNVFHCLRCGQDFTSRSEIPSHCTHKDCRSAFWDIARKYAPKKQVR